MPDGRLRTESSTGPVRVHTTSGWRPVDTRLRPAGARRVAPRVGFCPLSVGTRGAVAGQVAFDGSAGVQFGLPAGQHSGAGQVAGNRVVFDDGTVEVGNDSVTLSWPAGTARTVALSVSSAQIRREDGGWTVLVDGHPVGALDAPVLVGADGRESRVAATVTRDGRTVGVRVPGGLDGTVQVTFQGCGSPRAESGAQDAWTSQSSPDSAHAGTTSLQVGTKSTEVNARAFLKFDTGQWVNQKVVLAHLKMTQHEWSTPCASNEALGVRRVSGFPPGWSPTTSYWSPLRWAFQPEVGSELARSDSWCIPGQVVWDVTQLADNWENGAWPDHGLRVDAVNGAGTITSWRKFWSGNLHEGVWHADEPTMVVWGNYRPGLFYPDVQRRWPDTDDQLASLTPNVSGFVSDWDSNHVGMRVDICRWLPVDHDPPHHGVNNPLVGSPEHVPNVGQCKNDNWAYVRSIEAPMGEGGWRNIPVKNPGLQDNTWYAFYLRAGDGTSWGRSSATGFNMYTSVGELDSPIVGATRYPQGVWTEQRHPDNEFWLTGGPGVWSFDVYDNGQFVANVPADAWGGGWAIWPYDPPGDGWHTLTVYSINHLRQVSAPTDYQFGIGANPVSVSTPTAGQVSSRYFRVNAVGPPQATSATVEWSTDQSTWQSAGDTPVADCGGTKCLSNFVWDLDVSGPAASARPAPVWMRVRFDLPGGSVTGGQRQVTAGRNGFAGAAATTSIGPAQVALSTGDMQVSATDAAVPGYGDVLTVGRVWDEQGRTTRLPGDAGVFGTGWVADLPGPDSIGAMSTTVADFPDQGYLLLESPDAGVETYARADNQAGAAPGYSLYAPVGDTVASGAQVQYSPDRLLVQDPDGTVTTFTKTAGVWTPVSVQAPGKRVGTSAASTPQGRYAWSGIGLGGVDCSTLDLNAALSTEGCRTLKLEISNGLARSVSAILWNPDTSAMTETRLATYSYDADRLSTVVDDRTGLTTSYTYSGGHLATLTPASKNDALIPWRFTYTADPASGLSRLTQVERDRPEGGQATWRVVYDLPVNNPDWSGIPRLTFDQNAAGQTWVPTLTPGNTATSPHDAVAVFGPDHPVTGNPTATDWRHATLTYLDTTGRPVNTAVYGDNQWLVDSTLYNPDTSQVTATLSAANRITAVADCTDPGSTLCQYGPSVADRAALLSSTTTYGDKQDGMQSVVVSTRGPWQPHITTEGGRTVAGFTTTHTTYDQDAPAVPAGQAPYRLATTTTSRGEELAPIRALRRRHPRQAAIRRAAKRATALRRGRTTTVTTPFDTRTTAHRYTPDGTTSQADLTGPTSGWTLRQPTATIVDPGGLNLTTRTLYNPDGAVIKQVQPGSSGADAGTTLTDYYGAARSTGCTGRPEWNGLVCTTRRAADPGTGSGTLPVTSTTYTQWLSPKTVTETSGQSVRTTTTTYDQAERPVTVTVTGGTPGDTAVPAVTTTYDPNTGLPTQTSDGQAATTTGYDTWGRVTSYTDGSGATTSTGYDQAGRTAETVSPVGRTTYTYDTDTPGVTGEHRGLLTGIDYHLPDGLPSTTITRYGPDGGVDSATGPGGVTYTARRDTTGTLTHTAYTLRNGDTAADWTVGTGAGGQTLTQTAQFASAARGPASQDLTFGYDHGGRLTTAQDGTGSGCQARSYTYRPDGARTANTTGPCGQPGTTTDHTYNAYAQLLTSTTEGGATGTYDYDVFGRVRLLPGVDSPDGPTTADTHLSYYVDDQTHTTAHTEVTTRAKARTVRVKTGQRVRGRVTVRAAATSTYTQDPEGRLDTRTDTTVTTRTVRTRASGPRRLIGRSRAVHTTVNHYTGPGDSPGWDTTGTTTRRYLSDASGSLTATITIHDGQPAVGQIQIADPNGGITTTLPLFAHPTVGAIGPITLTTEYGQPTTNTQAGLYGWHGTAQRPTSPTSGLIQMGVRMYNPATGQFLTVDPILGGNTTPYSYPQNPVDGQDLNGTDSRNRKGQLASCARLQNPLACPLALSISYQIKARITTNTNIGNLQRHFVWNVMLMSFMSTHDVATFTAAHEYGDADRRDSARDKANNRYTRRSAVGYSHGTIFRLKMAASFQVAFNAATSEFVSRLNAGDYTQMYCRAGSAPNSGPVRHCSRIMLSR